MIQTISQVIENKICTNCGTCAGVCPAEALEMVETPGGQMLPRLDTERCINCGLCHRVCPQINISARMKKHLANPYIGHIQSAYLGEASDPMIASIGQTGGLARTLLASALELHLSDMAVCVMDNPKEPLRPVAILANTPEEVLKSSRSKYCPISVNVLIREIMKSNLRIAFLGLGCHMQGLQLAMEILPELQRKIVLKIGLFCDRVLSYTAANYLVRCAKTTSQNVAAFDYRHKAWRGWPGDIRVVTHDGNVRNVSRYQRINSRGAFTPIHCRLCIDKLNALSDISIGDPYGVAEGKQVPTAAIVRTEVGQNLLLAVQKAGKIILAPAQAKAIIKYQNIDSRMNNCMNFGQEMMRRHHESPLFLRDGPLAADKNSSRPLWVRLTVGFTIFADTARGTHILRRIPLWVPTLLGKSQRLYKIWQGRFARLLRRVAKTVQKMLLHQRKSQHI